MAQNATNLIHEFNLDHVPLLWPSLFASIALFLTAFGFLSRVSQRNLSPEKPLTVPVLPYWTPLLGHLYTFIFNLKPFLIDAREKCSHGLFSMKLAALTHTMVTTPHLIKRLLQKRESELSSLDIAWDMLGKVRSDGFLELALTDKRGQVFGTDDKWKDELFAIWPQLKACIAAALLHEPSVTNMTDVAVRRMENFLPTMLSFAQSRPEQHSWERKSNIVSENLENGDCASVDADLWPLIRNFMATMSTPSIMGRDFLQEYPTALDDLWTFINAFTHLALGFPRWSPISAVKEAYAARDRLLAGIVRWDSNIDRSRSFEDENPSNLMLGMKDT